MTTGYINNTISSGQRNDCTIRALASLCNVPYEQAELVLAIAGKTDNRGFNVYDWIDHHNGRVLGCKFTLVRRHQRFGRFMLGNHRHVQAYINGVTYDYANRGISYRYCYQVELNAGNDATTDQLAALRAKGITTLEQWKPTRKNIIDNL
jgi:hypothetical protein